MAFLTSWNCKFKQSLWESVRFLSNNLRNTNQSRSLKVLNYLFRQLVKSKRWFLYTLKVILYLVVPSSNIKIQTAKILIQSLSIWNALVVMCDLYMWFTQNTITLTLKALENCCTPTHSMLFLTFIKLLHLWLGFLCKFIFSLVVYYISTILIHPLKNYITSFSFNKKLNYSILKLTNKSF